MSWMFWIIVFAWVVPFIMRRMSQPPRDRRQFPPRDRGYNRAGGYPGNPYPRGYPGQQPRQQNPAGTGQQLPPQSPPAGNSPGGNWWQQPIPPGTFPGQQPPRTSSGRPQEARARQRTAQQRPGQQSPTQQSPAQQRPGQQSPTQQRPQSAPEGVQPIPHADEPQGYRARKLAELDQQFTDQKISLEEYMKARNEVMRG